ncbi:MAG: hypothetical protein R3C14_25220 [Caldilineaceae bacterium]
MKPRLLTPWHRFLAKGFELLVGRERIAVESELPTGSEPPKVDTVLLRRETETKPFICCGVFGACPPSCC